MAIKPLGQYLLVELFGKVEREMATEAGILLTRPKDDRVDLVVSKATVLEVGKDVTGFKKGEVLYFNYFAGNTLIVQGKDPQGKDDKEYVLVHTEDVLAKEVA